MTALTNSTIPSVTDEQIAKYNTTYYKCDCQDRTIRGGSYRLNGDRVCKHIARQRSPQALVGPARRRAFAELEAKKSGLDPASTCDEFGAEWFAYIEF
jgi:hypothetical protein